MIPSTKNKLLVAESWTKIYQSFRNADFQSYDFDTLRRTMITYLRETYPEEFNDYIDSSEYIALIDLIAYLGQNLSFRVDLNARENFLETAQRKDSVLRLAQLISYNPTRNVPANGMLKISAISTTEDVIDSNGTNLANQVIGWNDPTNSNWYQQYISILNSAMPGAAVFGRPNDSKTIGGIQTQQYLINNQGTDLPIYSITKPINGTSMAFEITGATFNGQSYIYEQTPIPGGAFSYLFQNDNQGASSANSGFFVHLRQGTIASTGFTITNPVANELIGINANGINNTDVWLWQIDASGQYSKLWSKVDSLVGNNVIYNNIANNVRTVYTVASRNNDQIDLNFADGSFGDLPKGDFRLFYRQSNGQTYSITPDQLSGINITIPYANKAGNVHQLTLTLSLQYTITNSSGPESIASIKQKAPQTYYLQNRMITAEDYNIGPLTAGNSVLKVTSVNRISSGISKYFELSDISGRYSNTDIFAKDGMLYKESKLPSFEFKFTSRNEVFAAIKNKLEPVVASSTFKNFYYDSSKYPRPTFINLGYTWNRVTKKSDQTTGYFQTNDTPPIPVQTGYFSSNDAQYITAGALIKFQAPIIGDVQYYFLPSGELTFNQDDTTSVYKWSKIIQIVGDGANSGKGALNDGTGPVILSGKIPSTAIPVEIIPAFVTVFSYAFETQVVNLCSVKQNFGLSFDRLTRQWFIITNSNLDSKSSFDLTYQADTSNTQKDSSWMILFEWTGLAYRVSYRLQEYIFESDKQTAFFVDYSNNNYDYTTGSVIKDQIDVLGVNSSPFTPTIISPATTITNTVINPITLYTSTASTTGSAVLYFTATNLIASNNYNAIHPTINNVIAQVISTSTASITLASTLSNTIGSGTAITFVPVKVTAIGKLTSPGETANINLGIDYRWQIDSSITETDGYVEPKKVVVSFYDANNDGQIDNPDAFMEIVNPLYNDPQTTYLKNFIYFEISSDGNRYSLLSDQSLITAYPSESDVIGTPVDGKLFYFYTADVVKSYDAISGTYLLNTSYFAKLGRSGIKFHYMHNSGDERRIDPSKSNIIDIFVLTTEYDTAFRYYLQSGGTTPPLAPTSQSLENNFAATLDPIKSISDTIVFHPASYKVLFGTQAVSNLQATFKAVRNPARITSDNDLITKILVAINNFFNVSNWDFGQSFNFTELSTYVLNQMTPDILNFIIVPKNPNIPFGSLFEITCQPNELLISGATATDIEIIDAVTAAQINSVSPVITNTNASA